jgi:hypothetical protein
MKYTGFERKTKEAINDCKGAVKFCALNSLHHLDKAWEIRNIDIEMAMFRAITAEEEAASSLFYTLKQQRYENSKKLQFKKHTYKQAVYPFLLSVIRFIQETNDKCGSPFTGAQMRHTTFQKRKAISLQIKAKHFPDKVITPTPPLHFNITKDTGEVVTFGDDFRKLYEGNNFDSALKYIQSIANTRNQVLYADCTGIPQAKGDICKFIEKQKTKVFMIIQIVLMTDPWIKEGHSAFVQQALDSFLLLLDRIQENEITPPVKTSLTSSLTLLGQRPSIRSKSDFQAGHE